MAYSDRVAGMLMGLFLGDALGAPHEFRCNRKLIYTGKLEHQAFLVTQFQGKKSLSVGQVTDDSEMTLALLRTLLEKDGKYDRKSVISSYLEWANSGGWMLGKNTRALLKGVKTVKGYEYRMKSVLILPESEISQSNGAMMRCCPLALLSYEQYSLAVKEDSYLTNPCPVVYWCNRAYLYCLRRALRGHSPRDIFDDLEYFLDSRTKDPTPKEVLEIYQGLKKSFTKTGRPPPISDRNLAHQKGWCLHGLWCSLRVLLFEKQDFSARLEELMVPGADTDTIAAISCALVGAFMGFCEIEMQDPQSSNMEILFGCDTSAGPTPRPKKYAPGSRKEFFKLVSASSELCDP